MRVILSQVGHRYGDRPWLFRDLTATLVSGRVYSLTGPSGAGKSTMLALLAGWLPPAEGEIVAPEGIKTGWVFQIPHGSPHRSARDHVALPLLAQGMSPREADERADATLEQFGLLRVADSDFRELSGGEAQRLMLARGLAAAPDLFLVDEPTAQLDRATATEVNEAIAAIATSGTIVVVATHDRATRDACDDHLLLSGGGSDDRPDGRR